MTDLRGRCSSSKLSLSVCLNKFTKRSEKCSPITQPATAFCIDENLDAVSGLVNVLTVINKGLLLSLFLIVFFCGLADQVHTFPRLSNLSSPFSERGSGIM